MLNQRSPFETRYDYCKFNLQIEPDRLEWYYEQWNGAIFAAQNEGYTEGKHYLHAGGERDGGLRYYSFIASGPVSNLVKWLDWETWSPIVARLDAKEVFIGDLEGIRELYRYIEREDCKKYSHRWHSSRRREKKEGRDRGGRGFSIGSHKSDNYINCYLEKDGNPSMEIQCSGKALKSEVQIVDYMRTKDFAIYHQDPWGVVRRGIQAHGSSIMQLMTGLGYADQCLVLRHEYLDPEKAERDLEAAEKLIRGFSRAQLEAIAPVIQEELDLPF